MNVNSWATVIKIFNVFVSFAMQRETRTIRWGAEEENRLTIKSPSIGTIIKLNDREFMGLCTKQMVRFEPSCTKEYYPYQLTAAVTIPEKQIIVGITALAAEFVIIEQRELRRLLSTGVKTEDASIFNIIYSPRDGCLITAGEHLKTWNFIYTPPPPTVVFEPPGVEISLRAVILWGCNSPIMNPPLFDERGLRIMIDDGTGQLRAFGMNGEDRGVALNYQCRAKTEFSYDQKTRRFLTTNPTQGAVLWSDNGGLEERFLMGITASLSIHFLSDEYAIVLDAKNVLTVIDLKTTATFPVFSLEKKVTRFFVFKGETPRVMMCCGSEIIVVKLTLTWEHWYKTVSRPLFITRNPKASEAARILVVLKNAQMRLVSPRNAATLTGITPVFLSLPISCFYDRGDDELPDLKRDMVLIPFEDGVLRMYGTGKNPCESIGSLDLKITSVCRCMYKGNKCFCFGTANGNLIFYDYIEMKQVGRFVVYQYQIIGLFYNRECDSLILVYQDRIIRFDMRQGKMFESVDIKTNRLCIYFDGNLCFGYQNGSLGVVTVGNGILEKHEMNGVQPHDDAITGLSLGDFHFVTCSADRTCFVWSRDFTALCRLVFPMPLTSCCLLNGKRDLLVATENDIMIVRARWWTNGVDPEDELYDNYDKRIDSLEDTAISEPEDTGGDKDRVLKPSAEQILSDTEMKMLNPVGWKHKMFLQALKKREREKEMEMKKSIETLKALDKADPNLKKKLDDMMSAGETKEIKKEEQTAKVDDENSSEYEEVEEYEYEEENDTDKGAPPPPEPLEEKKEVATEKPTSPKTTTKQNVESSASAKVTNDSNVNSNEGSAQKDTTSGQEKKEPPKTVERKPPAKPVEKKTPPPPKVVEKKTPPPPKVVEKKTPVKETPPPKKSVIDIPGPDPNQQPKKVKRKKKTKKSQPRSNRVDAAMENMGGHGAAPISSNVSDHLLSGSARGVRPSNSDAPVHSISGPQPVRPTFIKYVPGSIANNAPSFAQVRKRRKIPTPLGWRNGLTDKIHRITRPKTPEPRHLIISNATAPYNLVLDQAQLEKMIAQGDLRYLHLLRALNVEQELSSHWEVSVTFPMRTVETISVYNVSPTLPVDAPRYHLDIAQAKKSVESSHHIEKPSDAGFQVSEPVITRSSGRVFIRQVQTPSQPVQEHRIRLPPPVVEVPKTPRVLNYSVEPVLPLKLRMVRDPCLSARGQSPFAGRRFREYMGMDAPEKTTRGMYILGQSYRSKTPRKCEPTTARPLIAKYNFGIAVPRARK